MIGGMPRRQSRSPSFDVGLILLPRLAETNSHVLTFIPGGQAQAIKKGHDARCCHPRVSKHAAPRSHHECAGELHRIGDITIEPADHELFWWIVRDRRTVATL